MEQALGLPAHPLLVHAPIVLMPLTALMAVAFIVWPRSRQVVPVWVFPALCGLMLVLTILATESGEAFDGLLKGLAPVEKHEELAETTRLFVAVLFAGSLGQLFVTRRSRRAAADAGTARTSTSAVPVETVAAVLIALVALVATVWMFRTGHEGARIVWEDTVKKR